MFSVDSRAGLAPAVAVPNVRGTPAAHAVAPRGCGCRTSAIAAFRKFEAQRSGNRIGLGETQREPLADAVRLARLIADELLRALVVAEIFLPQVLGEEQTVAAQVLDRREEAERLDSGNPAFDELAHLISKARRDIAVDRLPLGFHCAPLEHRDLFADLLEPLLVSLRKSPLPEVVRLHQRAVDEKVGVAADRRGEVRVRR